MWSICQTIQSSGKVNKSLRCPMSLDTPWDPSVVDPPRSCGSTPSG
ncbi:MAG TPA: hypothetical protein VHO46_14625 [Bacteroidales bacterium]|nr:hypothetical protein [Bacteroidales bacterium]